MTFEIVDLTDHGDRDFKTKADDAKDKAFISKQGETLLTLLEEVLKSYKEKWSSQYVMKQIQPDWFKFYIWRLFYSMRMMFGIISLRKKTKRKSKIPIAQNKINSKLL